MNKIKNILSKQYDQRNNLILKAYHFLLESNKQYNENLFSWRNIFSDFKFFFRI